MRPVMALFLVVPLLLLLLAGGVLLRLALRVTAAAGLAGVAGVLLSQALGLGVGFGLFLAVLLWAPMLLLVSRRRRGHWLPSMVAPPAARSAWEQLRRAAPWAKRPLIQAEKRCVDFLLLAEAHGYQPETAELQVLVEKRVPELIASALSRSLLATALERRQLLDETIASVTEVAAAAEAQRASLWRVGGDGFAAQRAHLADRLRPGPLSSI